MKKMKIALCLVVLCMFFLVLGCTDNKALREIKDQMQAEKEQKEIDALADEIVKVYMREKARLLNEVRWTNRTADSVSKEWGEMLDDLQRRADNGSKASRRALTKLALE